jgi:hypothetical protein
MHIDVLNVLNVLNEGLDILGLVIKDSKKILVFPVRRLFLFEQRRTVTLIEHIIFGIALEGELEQALYKAGLISPLNYGSLHKVGWSRSSRTDKV